MIRRRGIFLLMLICFASIIEAFDNKLGIKKIKVIKSNNSAEGTGSIPNQELRSWKPKTRCTHRKTKVIIEGHKYSPFNLILCLSFRNRCSETVLYLGYLAVFLGSPGGTTVDPSTPTEEKMVGRPLISGPIPLIFFHGNHPASSGGEWSPFFHYPHLHSTLITSGVSVPDFICIDEPRRRACG